MEKQDPYSSEKLKHELFDEYEKLVTPRGIKLFLRYIVAITISLFFMALIFFAYYGLSYYFVKITES